MNVYRIASVVLLAGISLASVAPAAAQVMNGEGNRDGHLIVTVNQRGSRPVPTLQQKDVTVLLKNKPAEITGFTSLRGQNSGLQLVFLFDDSAASYLALQIPSIRKFIEALPSSVEVAVAYMSNGRAVMAQTLTRDHTLAGKSLRLTTSVPGVSASPYFCLSDLAKHWPSQTSLQTMPRRVVFMVTNGEDPYYTGGDLQDPYVRAAIMDSQRAGLLVYSIYFRDNGFRSRGRLGVLYGQSYLLMVSSETGGMAYNNGMMSPVSFDPFLQQLKTSLENQYLLTIAAQGSGLQRVKVNSNLPDLKLTAPTAVNVGPRQ
jgi:hypothetical protein